MAGFPKHDTKKTTPPMIKPQIILISFLENNKSRSLEGEKVILRFLVS